MDACSPASYVLASQEFRIAHDRGQWIVDFVGSAGHQLAERGELLLLHEMSLQALQVFVALARFIQQRDQCRSSRYCLRKTKDPEHQRGGHGRREDGRLRRRMDLESQRKVHNPRRGKERIAIMASRGGKLTQRPGGWHLGRTPGPVAGPRWQSRSIQANRFKSSTS